MQSDQPVKRTADDLFDRKYFSQRIAEVIASRGDKESLVIGVHAPWGDGKTSVINMVEEYLEKYLHDKEKTLLNGDIILYKFNPWRYGDEETLLRSYFLGLAEAVGGRIEKGGEKLADLLERYSWVTVPVDAFKISAFGLVDLSLDSEKILKKISEAKGSANAEQLKTRIEKILDDTDKRIVVFMDDIDRLDKDEIQAVFRLVKLTSNFPNTTFVLAFDPDRVAEALQDQYGGIISSKSFVEKIVQLPLALPPLTADKLIDATFRSIDRLLSESNIELEAKAAGDWGFFFRTHFRSYLKSPRQIKRFINNLYFFLPEMKDELFVPDLLSIEAIHIFFPEAFNLIRRRKDLFLLESTRIGIFSTKEYDELKSELASEIGKIPEPDQSHIRRIIIKLFPRTETVFGNTSYRNEWFDTWEKAKRITAPNYFQRYFHYGIADSDISDLALSDFITSLTQMTEEDNVKKLRNLISNDRHNLLIDKLSVLSEPSDTARIQALAMCLAISQNFEVSGRDFFSRMSSPATNAVRFVRELLERIEDETEREMLARQIASRAEPLDFALEFADIAKFIGKERGVSLEGQELSPLANSVLREVARRIADVAQSTNLDEEFPHRSHRMLQLWQYVDREAALEHIRSNLGGRPDLIDQFVRSRYRQNYTVASIAKSLGYKYIVEGLETANPDLAVPVLQINSPDGDFFVDTEEDYIGHFIAIAKQLHPDFATQKSSSSSDESSESDNI